MGSANVGSRGSSWTKEVGLLVTNCPKLAVDAKKIFNLYWSVDGLKSLPKDYPRELSTQINQDTPLKVLNNLDNTIYKIFLGSSPQSLSAHGRSDDLDSILYIINSAKRFIYIAVNEYIPMDLWKKRQPWTVIEDAIKKAVKERKIIVKFLVNSRASHKDLMLKKFESLKNFAPDSIDIKVYMVGNSQSPEILKIPIKSKRKKKNYILPL